MSTRKTGLIPCCWNCGSLDLQLYLEGQRCSACGATSAHGDVLYTYVATAPTAKRVNVSPKISKGRKKKT